MATQPVEEPCNSVSIFSLPCPKRLLKRKGATHAGASRAASDLVAVALRPDLVVLDLGEDADVDGDGRAAAAEDAGVVEDGEEAVRALGVAARDLLGGAAVALLLGLLDSDGGALALASILLGESDRGGGKGENDGGESVHFEGWDVVFGIGIRKSEL